MQTQTGLLVYKNSTDCFIKTWRGEGIRGFYKGKKKIIKFGGILIFFYKKKMEENKKIIYFLKRITIIFSDPNNFLFQKKKD